MLQETNSQLLCYGLAVIVGTLAGGLFPILFRHKTKWIGLFISFGAGVLLSAALLHMLPEASQEIGGGIGLPVLLGFLLLYFLEKFMLTHPCPSGQCEVHRVDIGALFGLSLHSLVTGLALGGGILVPGLGMAIFLAVIIHKIPESLSLSILLIKEGWEINRLIIAIFAFSLIVPSGAVLIQFFSNDVNATAINYLIAFSAGIFLYIAVDDLMPEVHRQVALRKTRLAFFTLGIILMGGLKLVY